MNLKLPFIYSNPADKKFLLGENNETENTGNKQSTKSNKKLSGYYLSDLNTLKKEFGYKESGDVKLREFTVKINSQDTDAAVFFIDGLTDKSLINDFILLPMMVYSREIEVKSADNVINILLPQAEASQEDNIDTLSFGLNFGSVIILINGMEKAISVDVKGWEEKPIG